MSPWEPWLRAGGTVLDSDVTEHPQGQRWTTLYSCGEKRHKNLVVIASPVSYLEVVHKFLYFHLGLVHACHVFETHTFTGLAVHNGELGHLQLIL